LADTFHAPFQTVPLQRLFPLFPHSTRIAKGCCHCFSYKSIPWMLWDLITDIFLRPNPFVNVIFLKRLLNSSQVHTTADSFPLRFQASFRDS
jgi:hypothetical protein